MPLRLVIYPNRNWSAGENKFIRGSRSDVVDPHKDPLPSKCPLTPFRCLIPLPSYRMSPNGSFGAMRATVIDQWSIDRQNLCASSRRVDWWLNETERTIWNKVIRLHWKSILIDQWSIDRKNVFASSRKVEWWSNETQQTIRSEVITFYWKSIIDTNQ